MPASALPELRAPLAVACHDAGASNIVLAWLRAIDAADGRAAARWRVMVEGPARTLWNERPVSRARICETFDELLEGAAMLLSGTGWASSLEHDARAAAKSKNIESLAVVDHWVNYRERFERHGLQVLPDRILVTDEHALREAARCFPGVPVAQCANAYLEEAVGAIRPVDAETRVLLYVLGPLGGEGGERRRMELQALDFLATHLAEIVGGLRCSLRIRLHPSDTPKVCEDWLARNNASLDVRIDSSASLAEAISCARWVAGAESYAMVVALAAGRQVFSSIPPGFPRCRLPHPGILHLRDLVAAQAGADA